MGAADGAVGAVAVAGTLEPYLGPVTGIVVDAAIFLVVVAATYVIYKSVVTSILRRVFDRQGLDEHARR
ncbi:mechanosensitive ion channel protein, partial [Halorubrum sp. E3]